MSRVLAQAVSRNVGWRHSLRLQYAPRRDRHGQNRWLCNLSQLELVLGSFEAQLRKFVAECGVGFVERLFCNGIHCSQFASHADLLRALSGKHECNGRIVRTHPINLKSEM